MKSTGGSMRMQPGEPQFKGIQMLFRCMLFLRIASGFVLSACGHNQSISNESTFFVEGVSIDRKACEEATVKELEVACHRLTLTQNQLVVAYRLYEGGREPSFTKLTIALPLDAKDGDVFKFPSLTTSVFYSTGVSFSPGKSGCFGFAQAGTVAIKQKTSEAIIVDIKVHINASSPLNWPGECTNININKTFAAHVRQYDDLSPWDGVKKDADIIDETVDW